MTDDRLLGLGGGLRAPADDAALSEEKSTREQAERWALAVGGEIARISQVATPAPAASEAVAGTTSGWRTSAGDLTPSGQTSKIEPGPSDGDDASERLTLKVDGGDLGALSLLVDRKQGAISVTIGVRDSSVEAAIGLERRALEQALAGHGITLSALRIVRADGLGTVLAPPRTNANQRARTDGDNVPNDSEKRRLARKLNLVG